ncbi:restriction endonuclease subunit S [Halothiobacillus sp. DCM-1]|uniref:restriction endonuclease subunit S n=1 Tax=Halothiobacillus sp. DCM-1 TaxID=3112558 RepID=UPI0032467A1E
MTVAEVIAADTTGLLAKHPSWERVPLAQVADILNGAPFDSTLFTSSEGMPLARIRDVLTGDTSTYYTGPYEETYVIGHGDLLVGMDGDFNSGFWGIRPALLNQRVCKITPIEQFYDKRLLSLALPGYLAAINANTPSVTVKHLSSKTIGEIELPLPPRAEQTRIVAKLEELLSSLDAGVAELKAAQKKLGQYRQSLLKAAVEGALTAEWRAARQNTPHPNPSPARGEGLNPNAAPSPLPPRGGGAGGEGDQTETGAQLLQRILTERRARWEAKQFAKFAEQGKTPPKDWQKKYPEPVQPDTTDLPELPEGWVWASVDQLLADIETGKSFKCEERPPRSNEVGVVKVSAVSWGDYNEQESKTCHDESMIRPELFVNAGDFLLSRANTIELVGACVIAKTVTKRVMLSDKILRFDLVREELKTWLLTLLRSELGRKYIEQLASGNQESMRNIGQERLRQIPIPLPCLNEIAKASELLSVNLMAAKEQEQAIDHALKQSAAQRQNILRAAFAGQLVPQDPNDEPASVLLERIRAERAARQTSKKPRGRKIKECTL